MSSATRTEFDAWADGLVDLVNRYPDTVYFHELIKAQMVEHIHYARDSVPKHGSFEESAKFYGFAVAASVRLLTEGQITNYAEFRQVASAVFGWSARPYIPSLFAAALMHPGLDREYAEALMTTMTLYDLRLIEDD